VLQQIERRSEAEREKEQQAAWERRGCNEIAGMDDGCKQWKKNHNARRPMRKRRTVLVLDAHE
jgi:hypothetical protein